MRPSLRALSASLLAATMGMSIFGGPDGAVAFNSQANERGAVMSVGASVMPLPVWPPARLRKEQCQRSHRGRVACTDRAASSTRR
jgi:hypothetical protein